MEGPAIYDKWWGAKLRWAYNAHFSGLRLLARELWALSGGNSMPGVTGFNMQVSGLR